MASSRSHSPRLLDEWSLLRTTPTRSGSDRRVHALASRDLANPASERILLTQPHSTVKDHYAGQLQFDSSGLLYVSVGGDGDEGGLAQDLTALWGKVLRIRPTSGAAGYEIPSDNPFASTAGARPEIWAYGLRNPWRFSLDRQTGDLVIADVGQARADEVNLAHFRGARGANFGWNCFEGFQPYASAPRAARPTHRRITRRRSSSASSRRSPSAGGAGTASPAATWCATRASLAARPLPLRRLLRGELRSVSLDAPAGDAATGSSSRIPVWSPLARTPWAGSTR